MSAICIARDVNRLRRADAGMSEGVCVGVRCCWALYVCVSRFRDILRPFDTMKSGVDCEMTYLTDRSSSDESGTVYTVEASGCVSEDVVEEAI